MCCERIAALERSLSAVCELFFPERFSSGTDNTSEIDVFPPLGQDAVRETLPRDPRNPLARTREKRLSRPALEQVQRKLER